MNVNNNLNPVDYWFNSTEIFKHTEDLKQVVFNEEGTFVIFISKISEIIIYDVFAKCIVIVIEDYLSNEERNITIKSTIWNSESNSIFIAYLQENKIKINTNDTKEMEENEEDLDLEPGEIKLTKKPKSNNSNISLFHNVDEIFFNSKYNEKSYIIFNIFRDLCLSNIECLFLEKRYDTNKSNTSNNPQRRDKHLLVNGTNPAFIDLENKNLPNYLFEINSFNKEVSIAKNMNIMNNIDKKLNDNQKITLDNKKKTHNNLQNENFSFYFKDIKQLINNGSDFTKSYLLMIKELFLIFIIHENDGDNNVPKFDGKFSKLSLYQQSIYSIIEKSLSKKFKIVNCLDENFNSEIISFDIDLTNSLIVVNSSDKILRLFNLDNNTITLFNDFRENVLKKKWTNSYFYSPDLWSSNKLKNQSNSARDQTKLTTSNDNMVRHLDLTTEWNYDYIKKEKELKQISQNLIITALYDSSSIDFVILDLNTSCYVKKMDSLKYNLTTFAVHYKNYFNILIICGKKVFQIVGYKITGWEGFAPHFKFVENNVIFIEDDDYFDVLKKEENKIKEKKKILDNKLNGKNKEISQDNNTSNNNKNSNGNKVLNHILPNKNLLRDVFKPKLRNFSFFNKMDTNDKMSKESNELLEIIKNNI